MRYPILAAAAIALLPTFAVAQTNGAAAAPAANDGKNFSGGHQNDPDFSNLPDQPSVVYQGQMAVGTPMPETYSYYPVPSSPDYDYMVLNGHRVIVDHKTHTIYRVMP